MSGELQELCIHVVVAGACIYLSFRAFRRFKEQRARGCGSGGCGCKLKDRVNSGK